MVLVLRWFLIDYDSLSKKGLREGNLSLLFKKEMLVFSVLCEIYLKSLLKKSLTVTLITSLAMTASSILLANPIAHLFVGYDAELCDMTVNALRIYALSFLVCGFNIFGSAFFTGLNNGTASALISFLRTLVIQVSAVLLLPELLGIDGIWLAITVAETLTLLVTGALFLAGREKYHYA